MTSLLLQAWKQVQEIAVAVLKIARAIIYHPRRAVGAFLKVLWACRVSVLSLLLPSFILIAVPQGRDLFSYFVGPLVDAPGVSVNLLRGEALTIAYWSAMAGLTWLFWAYPIHSAARLILYNPDWLFAGGAISNSRLRRASLLYRPLIVWVPRLLGALPFVALSYACSTARGDIPTPYLGAMAKTGDSVAPTLELSRSSGEITGMLIFLSWVFLAAAPVFLLYVARLRSRRMAITRTVGWLPPRTAPLAVRYRAAIGDVAQISEDAAESRILLAMISLVLVALIIFPSLVNHTVYLALVVPIVAGAWVPFFTYLTLLGQRHHLPITSAVLVIITVLVFRYGDNHDITRSAVPAGTAVKLDQAIAQWKAANQCTDQCPPPLIVASAGGASRAAFFTVTVLGDLMDNPGPADGLQQASPQRRARHLVNRLFAISGVSGGSVGAAIFAAALANSKDGKEPCRDRNSAYWFRAGAPSNWRGCLQTIVAEDFLSETILGLSFRDNLNFLDGIAPSLFRWPDRAKILEESWIAALDRWVEAPDDKGVRGLDQPFLSFAPQEGEPWRPLLILNGTSVTTGRRILTSHLALDQGKGAENRIFLNAYNLYDLLAAPGTPTADIRLATAATNSARFPIISPPGTLRAGAAASGNVVDRVVDGGYFENDGITTTIDLVRALQKAGLKPVVLHIANDPLPDRETTTDPFHDNAPALPDAPEHSWLSFVNGPLGSLFATRGARASYGLAELLTLLPSSDRFAQIFVFGEPQNGFKQNQIEEALNGCFRLQLDDNVTTLKSLSMSWWLSQPVQEYLDSQLKVRRNCDALDRVRNWLDRR